MRERTWRFWVALAVLWLACEGAERMLAERGLWERNTDGYVDPWDGR